LANSPKKSEAVAASPKEPKAEKKPAAPALPARPVLTQQALAKKAHEKLGPQVKKRITEQEILAAIRRIEFADITSKVKVPRLVVTRLRFVGEIRLSGRAPRPFTYDQSFQPGVNVILVSKNGAGKSSILKTIKFCLTGDDSEYDEGVRDWIENIWLYFSLDNQPYTMLLSKVDGVWHGMIADGEESRPLAEAVKDVVRRNKWLVGTKAIQEALGKFFFQHYALASLGWTRKNPANESQISECEASWRTYFQAMRIRDDDHKYLLCGPEPALAHQDSLLFTAYLGLQFAEPINRIGVEASLIEKAKGANEERAEDLREKKAELEGQQKELQRQLTDLEVRQTARMEAFLSGDATVRLAAIEAKRQQEDAQILGCQERIKSLASEAQRERANAQRLRTLIELKREFTGLDVTICPRCAKPVSDQAIAREDTHFECRLCQEPAGASSLHGADRMEAMAQEALAKAARIQELHTQASHQLRQLQEEREQDGSAADALRQAAQLGAQSARPTDEEKAESARLNREFGKLIQQIVDVEQELTPSTDSGESRKQTNVLTAIKAVLTEEAELRNQATLARLSEITTGVINAIGAKEFTALQFSALGKITFIKNGSPIAFTALNNPGERFRVKLAVLLALMRLGREEGVGHHPGLLLIDQPGAAEMVLANRHSFAEEMKKIDTEFADQVQIICFTAKPDFANATAAAKVYGPQAPDVEGGPYAF
jgi:hypothetical protein